jgi:hypothetical protein
MEEPNTEEEPLWKPEMICSSPLARLSSLDVVGRDIQRAETPGELDYAQLGTMKLGSLVVTNGMASPCPSVLSHAKSAANLQPEEEFFTASEGELSYKDSAEFGPLLPRPSNSQYSDHISLISERSSWEQSSPRKTDQAAPSRRGSPLKREIQVENRDLETPGSLKARTSGRSRQPRRQHSAISLLADDSMPSSDDDLMRPPAPAFWKRVDPNQSAVSLADEYIADLPPSPFTEAPDDMGYAGVVWENQTAAPEQDADEGFYDASPGIEELLEQRQAALAALDGDTPAKPIWVREITPETALGSHPPEQTFTLRPAVETGTSEHPKSDSGYSSGASVNGLDTLMARKSGEVTSATPQVTQKSNSNNCKIMSSAEGAISLYSLHRILADGPKPEDGWIATDSEATNKAVLTMQRSKSWKKSSRKSLPRLLSNESTVSVVSKSSKASTSGKSTGKKLQKRRAFSHQPLSFRNPHDLDGVPRVPSTVFERFSERLADNPEMQHLDKTYESFSVEFSTESSREASEEPEAEFVNTHYTFPDAGDEYTIAQRHQFATAKIDHPPPTPPHRFGISRSRSNKKAVAEEEEQILGLADFGDVARHLGSSPYDAAVPIHPPRRPHSATATAPFQLSPNLPRFGPVAGMDDETASRFAQMRSQRRAAVRAAMENAPRPEIPSRSRTYDESGPPMSYHNAPQGWDGRMTRPSKSIHGESTEESAPMAMPRLRPKSAGPAQSRPTSRVWTEVESYPLPPPVDGIFGSTRAEGAQQGGVEEPPVTTGPVHPLSASPHQPLDWSTQAGLWRARKQHAHTTVQTASLSNQTSSSTKTTTTTVITPAAQSSTLPSVPSRPNPFTRRSQQIAATPTSLEPTTQTLSTTSITTTTTAAIEAAPMRPKTAGAAPSPKAFENLPPEAKYARPRPLWKFRR